MEIFRVLLYGKVSSWLLIYVTVVSQTHPVYFTVRTLQDMRIIVPVFQKDIVQTSSHVQFYYQYQFFERNIKGGRITWRYICSFYRSFVPETW